MSAPGNSAIFGRAPGLATGSDLAKLKAKGGDQQEAILEVAKQFESIFLHQVFKSMRATVPKDGMTGGGFGADVFTDMLDQQYADVAAKSGSMGLAKIIATQLGGGVDHSEFKLKGGQPLRRLGEPLEGSVGIRRMGQPEKAYAKQSGASNWQAPVEGKISVPFGFRRHFANKTPELHGGIDLVASAGSPIRAARGGRVTFAGEMGDKGRTVIVDHGDSTSSVYAHASELLVREGEMVAAGVQIAKVGQSGNATQPQLHFEIRQGGRSVDPTPLLGLDKDKQTPRGSNSPHKGMR